MNRALSVLPLALAFAATPALANPHNAFSALVGASTALDDDPASLRLSLRGDMGIAHDDPAGVSFLVPVTIASSGNDGFGFSGDRVVVEVPVGVRGTLLPHNVIRPYGDLGVGVAFGASQDLVPMTRAALGLELGPNESLSFVLEPVEVRTYYPGGATVNGYSVMLGLVAPI